MQIVRTLFLAASCAAVLTACVDHPAEPRIIDPTPRSPLLPMGVYEVTITGADGSATGASLSRAAAVPQGPSLALNPVAAGLTFESVSTTTYTEGTRTTGGQRFIVATFRVRNTTGAPVSNVTMLPVMRATTITGTPFSSLLLFNGTAAPTSIASQIVPTGSVALGDDGRVRSSYADVLQVFTEAEVAAVALPDGTTGVFPYGFVVRNPQSTSNRTLANAATSSDWGLVTFAFRYPLQATAAGDPFSIGFQFLAVQDTETRLTESFEERQDTSGVRRVRERALALGATTVTVLAGSAATDAAVTDYPGQRQVCTVRTAGTAGAPTNTITSPGAYTDLAIYRPGESLDSCGAYFATGTAATAVVGAPYSLTVRAMDRYGNVRTAAADSVRVSQVSGPSVTLGAQAALVSGVATIQATYAANGASVLQAIGRNVRGAVLPQVTVGATSVAAYAGSNQAAMAGTNVPTRPAVRVLDGNGAAVVGRSVTFAVATGGGSVTTATVNTDASGIATVGSWTLGATAQLNTLTATVSGTVSGNPVTFNGAGCEGSGAGYEITLCYSSTLTASQRTTFQTASARWSQVITGDLSNLAGSVPAAACASWTPAMNMTYDDLVIFASLQAIDGPGAVLGSASPCYVRNAGQPVIGLMQFDIADVANLEAAGQFNSVILHEMGHVIGIGSMWEDFGLVQSPSSAGTPLDTYFSGANGIAGFNSIGGSTYTGGNKVPVENTGGGGTMNAHWRESVLQNELMTGYLNSGVANPLSLLTVRSLADMGYTVNTGAADSFFLTLSLRTGPEAPGLHMMNDVHRGPRYTFDANGRARRRS